MARREDADLDTGLPAEPLSFPGRGAVADAHCKLIIIKRHETKGGTAGELQQRGRPGGVHVAWRIGIVGKSKIPCYCSYAVKANSDPKPNLTLTRIIKYTSLERAGGMCGSLESPFCLDELI